MIFKIFGQNLGEIVEFLLDSCAKVNVANSNGETPRQLCLGFDIEEIYEKHGLSQIGKEKVQHK